MTRHSEPTFPKIGSFLDGGEMGERWGDAHRQSRWNLPLWIDNRRESFLFPVKLR